MKVAFFTYGSSLYGANLSMVELILGLRSLGIESMVFSPEYGKLSERLAILNISESVHAYANGVHWRNSKPVWHPRKWVSITACAVRAATKSIKNGFLNDRLASIAKDFGAQVIVTNTCVINIGVKVAHTMGIPHIWHIREFGDLDWKFYPDYGFKARSNLMAKSHAVVFVSNAVKKHHHEQLGLKNYDGHNVIYNSIGDEAELCNRSVHSRHKQNKSDRFTFGIAGYVMESKGQFDAVSALSSLIRAGFDVKLSLAGGGEIDELRRHTDQLAMNENVDILGHLEQSEMPEFYRNIDCGLMCSQCEAFGRATAEFMSWGKPVIGRKSGGTSEIIQHGINGVLYDGSVDGLALAMKDIASDINSIGTKGKNAAAFAHQNFSREKIATQFCGLLNRISP